MELQLAKVGGLRERVEETLLVILDAALEIRDACGSLADPRGGFLRVQVRDYMISYTLDVEQGAATVVFAEKLSSGSSGDNASAA